MNGGPDKNIYNRTKNKECAHANSNVTYLINIGSELLGGGGGGGAVLRLHCPLALYIINYNNIITLSLLY